MNTNTTSTTNTTPTITEYQFQQESINTNHNRGVFPCFSGGCRNICKSDSRVRYFFKNATECILGGAYGGFLTYLISHLDKPENVENNEDNTIYTIIVATSATVATIMFFSNLCPNYLYKTVQQPVEPHIV